MAYEGDLDGFEGGTHVPVGKESRGLRRGVSLEPIRKSIGGCAGRMVVCGKARDPEP